MNSLEKLVGIAIVVILGFMVVNNYVSNFLVNSGWEASMAAPISLVIGVVIVGLIMGVVTIAIKAIFNR